MNRKQLKARRNRLICEQGRLRNRLAGVRRSLRSARRPETIDYLTNESLRLLNKSTALTQRIEKL